MKKNKLLILAGVGTFLTATAFGLNLLINNNASAIVQPQVILSSINPTSGMETGGYEAVIQGATLGGVTSVLFGNTEAQVVSVSEETVTVIVPPHSAGPVDVSLQSYGMLAVLPMGFTYTTVTPPEPEDPCKKDKKTAICHYPPGNSDNPHLICLPPGGVTAHLKQHPDDYQGLCEEI